jgi:phosphocarrier protein HPr
MKIVEVTVINEVGLHARPAAVFVQAANRFKSQIKVRNLTKNSNASDAKSILGVLVLGIEKNHVIQLEINGEDETDAAKYLTRLVKNDFQLINDNDSDQNGNGK